MTTARDSTMTLEQVRDWHVYERDDYSGHAEMHQRMIDAIDAHLATRDVVVSDGIQARYRLPGEEWSSWGHVVNGVKGHEMELRATPESLASRKVASPEDRFEQYVGTLIDHSVDIQRLGEWLGNRLDEDDFNTVEPMILGIAEKLKEVSRKVAVPDEHGGEVILEHSGCGHGAQMNQLTVKLYPGDKVLMFRGRLGKAMLASQDEVK